MQDFFNGTPSETANIRLGEMEMLLGLVELGSVRDLARKTQLSPGNISKQIRALEKKLKTQLLDRSPQGVKPTAEASRLLPYLRQILDLRLAMASDPISFQADEFYSIATSSILGSTILPSVLSAFEIGPKSIRFRLLEMPPNQFLPLAMRGGIQICLHSEDIDWPGTWTTVPVGELEWGLYARRGHSLSDRSSPSVVKQHAFVYPAYWTEAGIRQGDDLCPVPIGKRILGSETATAATAIEVVAKTDQIGFFLKTAAREMVKRKQIREIKVSGWPKVKRTLYLSVKSELVQQSTFSLFQSSIMDYLQK